MDPTLLKDREAPPALGALLPDVLLADAAPEDVIIGEALPQSADLGGAAEGGRVEIAENLKGDFVREDGEGVYPDQMRELLGEEGELGEAAHGEQAVEDEGPARVGRGREVGPDGADGDTVLDGEGVECLEDKIVSTRARGWAAE